MKLPSDCYVDSAAVQNYWWEAAQQISMDTGIYIGVGCDYHDASGMGITRVYFEVNGHQFESLNDLKKAIANKAFL